MYFIAFTANQFDAEIYAFTDRCKEPMFSEHDNIPTWVVMHPAASMTDPAVLANLVRQWKASFHPSELPITTEMEDAANAFCEWLEGQPFGYIVPKTHYSLVSLPIYDNVIE